MTNNKIKTIQSPCTTPEELIKSDDFFRGLQLVLEKSDTDYDKTNISDIFIKLQKDEILSPEDKKTISSFIQDEQIIKKGNKLLAKLEHKPIEQNSKNIKESMQFSTLMGNILHKNGMSQIQTYVQETAGITESIINKNINIDTNKILEERGYDSIGEFKEGFAVVSKNDKYGYINSRGDEVFVGLIYDNAIDFNEGFGLIFINGKAGYIDKNGKLLGEGLVYEKGGPFHNGFTPVKKNGKLGYIDKNGILVGDGFTYDGGTFFNKGFNSGDKPIAGVYKNGKWGLMDTNGKILGKLLIYEGFMSLITGEIINIQDGEVQDHALFGKGFAVVQKDGQFGHIDKDGIELGKGCIYDNISAFNIGGNAFVHKDGKWGCINTDGNLLGEGLAYDTLKNSKNPKYSSILKKNGEKFGVTKEGIIEKIENS